MTLLDKAIRWFVGLLFIFSGLVKLNDPMGTAIKMEEYFEVFSNDISSVFHYLIPFALLIGLFVIILEVLLGVAVLINYRMNLASLIILLLIVFFTFLTFYSAAFNKVTDCGCFGDAIPLNPWQSFFKDIVLLILTIYIFLRRRSYNAIFSQSIGNVIIIIVLVSNIALAYYALEHLPPIDFRPYRVGANLKTSMQPSDEYRYKYIMEKDGETLEFEKYPTDTSYKFVEMVLLNPEAEPEITDYNIWNEDGDYTEETFNGTKLFIMIGDVNKTRFSKLDKVKELVKEIESYVDCWIITSNDEATYENFRHEYQIPIPYYYADGTVIKAMIRSNPGLLLIQNSIVRGKWHNNDIPSKDKINELIN